MQDKTLLSPEEELKLCKAREILERQTLVMLLADYIAKTFGYPIERILRVVPDNVREKISPQSKKKLYKTLNKILEKKVKWASRTLHPKFRWLNSQVIHHVGVTVTGFLGGFWGELAIVPELGVSTFLMLRSIASIAASHGEDLNKLRTRLECISIFAMGSPKKGSGDRGQGQYYATRVSLMQAVDKAAEYIGTKGFSRTAPAVTSFIQTIADRFGVVVGEKLAAQAAPIISGVSAAVINNLFMDHFNKVASAHFYIKFLERKYGQQTVRNAYFKCSPMNNNKI